jgi:hypothetical protein
MRIFSLFCILFFLPASISPAQISDSLISQVSFSPPLLYPNKTFQIEIKSTKQLKKASVAVFKTNIALNTTGENVWFGSAQVPAKIKAGKYLAKIYAKAFEEKKTILKKVYFFVKDYKIVPFEFSFDPPKPAIGDKLAIEVKPSSEIIKVSALFNNNSLSFSQDNPQSSWISELQLPEGITAGTYPIKISVRGDDGGLTVKKSSIEIIKEEEHATDNGPHLPAAYLPDRQGQAVTTDHKPQKDLKEITDQEEKITEQAEKTSASLGIEKQSEMNPEDKELSTEEKPTAKTKTTERISFGVELNPDVISPGQNVEIKIRPFSEVKKVSAMLGKEQIEVKEDKNGMFWTGIYKIPQDYQPGKYLLTISAQSPEDVETSETFELEVKKEFELPYNINDLIPLKGNVFRDENGNGKLDRREKPLGFAEINFSDFYGKVNRGVKTSKEGNYILNLPKGKYFVSIKNSYYSLALNINEKNLTKGSLNIGLKPKNLFLLSNLSCSPMPPLASPGEKLVWQLKTFFNDEVEKASLVFGNNDFISLVQDKIKGFWQGNYFLPENISSGKYKAKLYVRLKSGMVVSKNVGYEVFKS